MILIIGAMQDELEVVLNHLQNQEKLLTKTNAVKGFFNGLEIAVAISGIGKVNAAIALTELLNNYKFSNIVNIGLAGASHHFKIGQFVFVKTAIQYDFDIRHFGYQLGEIPNDVPFAIDSNYNYCNLEEAVLYTQDRFQTQELDIKTPYLVDMEGAAFLQVAKKFNRNLAIIKYVSDHVGSHKQSEQYADSEAVSGGEAIYQFLIKYLKGR